MDGDTSFDARHFWERTQNAVDALPQRDPEPTAPPTKRSINWGALKKLRPILIRMMLAGVIVSLCHGWISKNKTLEGLVAGLPELRTFEEKFLSKNWTKFDTNHRDYPRTAADAEIFRSQMPSNPSHFLLSKKSGLIVLPPENPLNQTQSFLIYVFGGDKKLKIPMQNEWELGQDFKSLCLWLAHFQSSRDPLPPAKNAPKTPLSDSKKIFY